MSRLLSLLKTDVVVQFRNKLYAIGIGVAVIIAIGISQLASVKHLPLVVPTLMLLALGGSTLLYVAGMILFEKDEKTINALITSPLRVSEYLWSKIITLSTLATIEGVVMVGGAMLIMGFWVPVPIPNLIPLFLGIMATGIVYCLVGIILVVRYEKLTDFILPMGAYAGILQVPFLYFLGLVEHPIFLVIPTSASTMLIKGAYVQLPLWQWIYAILYTSITILVFAFWAHRAFTKYITMKVG